MNAKIHANAVLHISMHVSAAKITSSEVFLNCDSMTAWLPSRTSSGFVELSAKLHLTKDTVARAAPPS
jgi:hypothetical protein